MNVKTNLANKSNYGSIRSTSSIKYIVIHFTANDGDSDEGNGNYFKNNIVKASAHYFVDSDSITQSVKDNYVAYSVGGSKYSNCKTTGGGKFYGKCTNANSISIELCDDKKNGTIYPSQKAIEKAILLTQVLMNKYNIPVSNVIRHFDVTGKSCPAYWCGSEKNNKLWKSEFHSKLTFISQTKRNKTKKVSTSYRVKITTDNLNIRKGAGTNYQVVGKVKKGEVYTIVEKQKNGNTTWLKLKSGVGYISSKYTTQV